MAERLSPRIVVGKVARAERIGLHGGSPHLRVRIKPHPRHPRDDWELTLDTKPGSQLGFSLENSEYREHDHRFSVGTDGRILSVESEPGDECPGNSCPCQR